MATNNQDLLWAYVTAERNLSEDEFKSLAQEAKERGILDQLYVRVDKRVELHRFLKDHFTINSELEKAEQQEKELMQAERELAIVKYLRFSDY